MSEIDVSKCPAYHTYNVFGTDDKGCCYLEHKYCDEVETCIFKESFKQLQAENDELKEQYKLAEPLFQACKIKDLKIDKYKTILDEIEKVCNSCRENAYCFDCEYDNYCQSELQDYILQLIKQAKEVNDENR